MNNNMSPACRLGLQHDSILIITFILLAEKKSLCNGEWQQGLRDGVGSGDHFLFIPFPLL